MLHSIYWMHIFNKLNLRLVLIGIKILGRTFNKNNLAILKIRKEYYWKEHYN